MICARNLSDAFLRTAENENAHRKPVERLTNGELKKRVCQDRYNRRGNCRACEISDLCVYGREMVKRGLA